jgi:REP element-mobilizing transposase RayT
MANYTQLFVQLVFAVHNREALITPQIEERLYAYIIGIIEKRKHTLIAIGGTADHIHILVRMHPTQSISDLVRDIKTNSSRMVNENKLLHGRFSWQNAYGAFTYSKSQVPAVKRYVLNQKEHHKKETFKGEILRIFEMLDIPYSDEYGFIWFEDADQVSPRFRVGYARQPLTRR